jgi:heat shock protein HslJ
MVWTMFLVGSAACAGPGRKDEGPRHDSDSAVVPAAAGESPGAPQGPLLVGTTWRLTQLEGKPAPLGQDGKAATLELTLNGKRVVGFAGCNRMAGTYQLNGDSLRLGPLALTRMACVKGMDLERGYVAALEHTRAYRLTPQGLELLGEAGSLAQLEAQ